MMMKTLRWILLPLAFTAAATPAENTTPPPSGPLNRIVAVVNNEVIVQGELNDKLALVRQQLRGQDTQLPPADVLERQVLERMVLERLQLQLAVQNGIRISDEDLNNQIRRLARQNNMDIEQFRAVLERDGYAYERFREDVGNEITLRRLRQQIVENRVHVSDQEIDNALATLGDQVGGNRSYHLAHILIAVPEAASPEQVQKAQAKTDSILKRLRAGADFRDTAVAESDGQQALEGGDLGWRTAEQIPTVFADLVVNMRPGDMTDPIRSPSGFHIIKLLEERGDQKHVITQTQARHILLRTNALVSDTDARIRLTQLRARIQSGEDFAALARANSQDDGTASAGGDLGWVTPGTLVPTLEEVMRDLQPGDISQPFQTDFGWHIVQVQARREHDSTGEFMRARARDMLRSRKIDEELELWLRRLRDESYVEYRLHD